MNLLDLSSNNLVILIFGLDLFDDFYFSNLIPYYPGFIFGQIALQYYYYTGYSRLRSGLTASIFRAAFPRSAGPNPTRRQPSHNPESKISRFWTLPPLPSNNPG
jgi:hypothetical protein